MKKSTIIHTLNELPKEFDLEKYVDYSLMFEKTFVEPVKAMTDSVGWFIEEQSDISDLFL